MAFLRIVLSLIFITIFQTVLATDYPPSMASGTLPILHIATVGNVPVVEKETKLDASLWVEIPQDCPSTDFALASEESPLALTIKGRGNSTWLHFEKKPYTLKFSKKTEICGMPKHKSFALLACAEGYVDWIGQSIGKDFARLVGLGWAPKYEPVELVLNGEYRGLYLLMEMIKIDSNRLDIIEQEDENTDEETIPYGWLVEIDNYADEAQVIIPYGGRGIRVTYKSPEVLSQQQRDWLVGQFTGFTSMLHSDHPERWTEFIEPHSMAKYFIVREVMNDYDGFNGSVYMYRDDDGDERWHMGPIWDTTIWKQSPPDDWLMYELPGWSLWKFLPIIFYTQPFKEVFLEEWDEFYPQIETLKPLIENLAAKCYQADRSNHQRWETPSVITSYEAKRIYNVLKTKANWIEAHKDYDLSASIPDVVTSPLSASETRYYNLLGVPAAEPLSPGCYIKVETAGGESRRYIFVKD